MGLDVETRQEQTNRESVPFRVRTADGETIELSYSSPRHRFAIAGLHCATLELVRDQDDE